MRAAHGPCRSGSSASVVTAPREAPILATLLGAPAALILQTFPVAVTAMTSPPKAPPRSTVTALIDSSAGSDAQDAVTVAPSAEIRAIVFAEGANSSPEGNVPASPRAVAILIPL